MTCIWLNKLNLNNKNMWQGVVIVFSSVAIVVCSMFFVNKCSDALAKDIKSNKDSIEMYLGNRILINKDTLIIMDYSWFNSSYKLSNNSEISFQLVKKYKTIK